METIRNVKK